MSRRLLARLGLVLAGLLAGLGLAEGLARLVRPAGHADLLFNAPDASPAGLYLTDPELLLVPAPGFEGTAGAVDYRVPLRINALGLRGPALPPQASRPRWLALGDSFTMAAQVAEDETFAARLGEAAGVEAWNGGVDGYSTWQALGRYRRLDGPVGAEGVLLTFFLGNDLQDNERFPHLQRQSRHLQAGRPIPRPEVPAITGLLLRHSHLFAQLRVLDRARALSGGDDPALRQWRDELSVFSAEGAQRLRQLAGASEAPLRSLRDAARQAGDRLVVALAPPAFVVDRARVGPTFSVVGLDPASARLEAPGQAVAALLQRLGVQACDLQPALAAAAEGGEALYFTYDGHWTPAGHRVVAEAMARCLEGR